MHTQTPSPVTTTQPACSSELQILTASVTVDSNAIDATDGTSSPIVNNEPPLAGQAVQASKGAATVDAAAHANESGIAPVPVPGASAAVVPTPISMGLAKFYAGEGGLIGHNPPPPGISATPGSILRPGSLITLREITDKYFLVHERIAHLAPPNTKYKKLETLSNERGHMIVWLELFGDTPVAAMDPRSKAQFVYYRQTVPSVRQYKNKDGTTGKKVEKMAAGATIDLCIITAVVICKWAFTMGLISYIPFWYSPRKKRLSTGPKRRELLSVEHVNALLAEAVAPVPEGIPALMGENAPRRRKQLQNYLSLVAWAGSRRKETTRLKWEYVTWPRRDLNGHYLRGEDGKILCGTLFFPKHIQKKGHGNEPEDRSVEFNPQLEALLLRMYEERDPKSEYLFPALQQDNRIRYNKRGEVVKRKPYQVRFDTGLSKVLTRLEVDSKDGTRKVKLAEYYEQSISIHHLRVFFVSQAIMAGVDLFTIAEWVGHASTEMIEEIYGQVPSVHRAAEALKLKFLPHTIRLERSVPQHLEKPMNGGVHPATS